MTPTLVCDLDGVVYLGNTAVSGSREAIEKAAAHGFKVIFATNNSARPPGYVAEKLHRVLGLEVSADDIITSSVVAAGMVRSGPVMVAGEEGVIVAVREAGFATTDEPHSTKTVVAGLDRGLSYERVSRAAEAIRRGAEFIATNRDPTYPTDRGLLPGAGACVAAIEVAAGISARTAGKPSTSMRRHIEDLAPDGPIWMVGDREDTDIALAQGERWSSILVETGVSGAAGAAITAATHVAANLDRAVDLILESHRR